MGFTAVWLPTCLCGKDSNVFYMTEPIKSCVYWGLGLGIKLLTYIQGAGIIKGHKEDKRVRNLGKKLMWLCLAVGALFMLGASDCYAQDQLTSETEKGRLVYDTDGIIRSYEGEDETLVIPGEIDGCAIKGIGWNCFLGRSSLKEVTLPEGLISIGERAFQDCNGLKGITLPEGLTSIEVYAFSGCSSLKSVTFPSSLERIGGEAFGGCISLESITFPIDGCAITEIGGFSGCSNLTEITLPEGLTSISGGAFSDCGSLAKVTLPGGLASIGEGAFEGCSSLETVAIPEGIETIERGTFKKCSSLKSVTFPNSLKHIADGTFGGAFEDCTSLESITFPDTLESIGARSFYNCSSLKAVRIPDSVTSLGDRAFVLCSALEKVELPEHLDPDTGYVFSGTMWQTVRDRPCGAHLEWKLEGGTLIVSGTGEMYGRYDSAFKGWPDGVPDRVTSIVIEKGVTTVGYAAFSHFGNLSSVTFYDGLIEIGAEAFADCPQLKEATIPLSVERIGSDAFGRYGVYYSGPDGKGTDYFTYEDGFTIHGYTGSEAEDYSKRTERIMFDSIGIVPGHPDGPEKPDGPNKPDVPKVPAKGAKITVGANTYKVTAKSKTVAFCKAAGKSGGVTIPATVKAGGITYRVTSIADSAFKGNTKVKTVTVGKNVTSIGKSAFENCKNLSRVTIGKNVVSIGKKAFYNDKKLKKIEIQTKKLTAKKVGSSAFKNIYAKAKVKAPAAKVASYKSMLRQKGVGKKVKITK